MKKGRSAGGQRQRKRKQGPEEEVGREAGQEEDAAAVEAMRLEKLAEWRAMMQSGEVGTGIALEQDCLIVLRQMSLLGMHP